MVTKKIIIDIINDPCMSLADWKILIDNLINKYGESFFMYTDAGPNNVVLTIESYE